MFGPRPVTAKFLCTYMFVRFTFCLDLRFSFVGNIYIFVLKVYFSCLLVNFLLFCLFFFFFLFLLYIKSAWSLKKESSKTYFCILK